MELQSRFFEPPARSFFLFGPRGTGKSTWIRHALPEAVVIEYRRRERKRLTLSSRSAAQRWGEARERELVLNPQQARPRKEAPTLKEFWPRFLNGYARANRQKPSGVAAKETVGRVHLVPFLGTKRLDVITTEDVQRLKTHLHDRSAKTVNNVLTVLNVLLKKAVEWDVIERVPCTIRLLPIPKPSATLHDFDDYERLVEAARTTDPRAYLIVLLAGEAGLRCGEIIALEWRDVNLRKRQLCIQRSEWKGHVTAPKGGRLRYVPVTIRLANALSAHRHLRSDRVLCQDNGNSLTQKIERGHVRRAARRAQITNGGVHVLRHTFCRTSRCAGRRRERFRSSRGTWISQPPSDTCISVPRRSRARFGCSILLESSPVVEILRKRRIARSGTP